jgi:hypothetical protein
MISSFFANRQSWEKMDFQPLFLNFAKQQKVFFIIRHISIFIFFKAFNSPDPMGQSWP